MKKVNDFNEFLFNMLLESEGNRRGHGVSELPFIISKRLKRILEDIPHPIASKLLKADEERVDKKVTFVDIDEEAENKFTIVNSNKAFDNIEKQFSYADVSKETLTSELKKLNVTDGILTYNYWTKNRSSIKIGSFINKVFPKEFKTGGDPGKDIESFVQMIIAKRTLKIDRFEIVEGNDIIKYYNFEMYDLQHDGDYVSSSPLGGSCMRYDECAGYINFYAQNEDVRLLILHSDNKRNEDKIVGRALLWNLSKPEDRVFMDRIYYRLESDMAMFKQYAEKQGWLYKNNQNMSSNARIVDTKTGEDSYMTLRTKRTFKETDEYPYMDTMKWFYVNEGYLSNSEDDIDDSEKVYFLEETDGSYEDVSEKGIYVEYYGEYYDEDDLVWCEYGEEYRLPEDAIWLEQYFSNATNSFVENNMVFSSLEDMYLMKGDSVYSEYHDDYINSDNAIEVYNSADEPTLEDALEEDTEYHHINDIGDSVLEYKKGNMTYHFYYNPYNEKNKYFKEVIIDEDGKTGWKHIVWDKDKLFKWKGKWYYDYDGTIKDKITGQKRLWD